MNQQGLTQNQRFALSRVNNANQRRNLLRSYNMQRQQNNGFRFRRYPRRRFIPVVRRNFAFNNRRGARSNMGFQNRLRLNQGYNRINTFRGAVTNKVSVPRSYGFNTTNPESSSYNIRRTAIIGELTYHSNSANFYAKAINIHPGNMPWVSSITKNFDKYRFISFKIRLLPNVGTNVSGMGFLGFNYENHHVIANSFIEAQSYDKFTSTPIWSDSNWISIPMNILSDKWYDCTFLSTNGVAVPVTSDSFHDFAPGRIIVGYSGPGSVIDNQIIARVEVEYNLVLSRPTLAVDVPSEKPKVVSNLETDVGELEESFSNISLVD